MPHPITNPVPDERPKRKGWAPGPYICVCLVCRQQFIGDKRAIDCAPCAYAGWKPTHQHRKGGLYQILHGHAVIEMTMTPAVVYESQDGTIWVRPQLQFHDGRFTEIKQEGGS